MSPDLEHVRQIVDAAPTLTERQVSNLRSILRADAAGAEKPEAPEGASSDRA